MLLLAERDIGKERIVQAIDAAQGAYDVMTPSNRPTFIFSSERHQLESASYNLCAARQVLALREGSLTQIAGVLDFCRSISIEISINPILWGLIQNIVGVLHLSLDEIGSGTSGYEEAITVFNGALQDLAEKNLPALSNMIKGNLGFAQWRLGARKNDRRLMEDATKTLHDALAGFHPDHGDVQLAIVQRHLAGVLQSISETDRDTVRLEASIAEYRNSLKTIKREKATYAMILVQYELGVALRQLGEKQAEPEYLREAVSLFTEILAIPELSEERVLYRAISKSLHRAEVVLKRTEAIWGSPCPQAQPACRL